MIRTTLPQFRLLAAFPSSRPFLTPTCYHNRQFSTSLYRSSLSTKQSHQEPTSLNKRGYFWLVRVHFIWWTQVLTSEELSGSSPSVTSPLTTHDATSTIPVMLRGDWVLFHPVYQPDELKAVQVCLFISLNRPIRSYTYSHARFCIASQRLFQINSLTDLLDLHGPSLTSSLDTSMSKALRTPKWPSRSCEKPAISLVINNGLRWVMFRSVHIAT